MLSKLLNRQVSANIDKEENRALSVVLVLVVVVDDEVGRAAGFRSSSSSESITKSANTEGVR